MTTMSMHFNDYRKYFAPAYSKSTDLVMEKGKGMYLWDVDGKKYIDWVQGIAVNALGHCHPRVIDAAKKQIDKLITAIGDVTLDSKDAIEKAQKAYDKLNSNAKSKVKNYQTLVEAKKKLEKLEKKNG